LDDDDTGGLARRGFDRRDDRDDAECGVATGAARPGRFSHLENALWQFANYLRLRLDTRTPRKSDAAMATYQER
jgi:hypothetical protein